MVVETNDTHAVVERAAGLAAARPIDGVLTTCDYYLAAAAAVAARLGLPGAAPDVMARAVRKHEVRAALDAAGLPPRPPRGGRHARPTPSPPPSAWATRSWPSPSTSTPARRCAAVDEEAHLKDAWDEISALARNTRGQALAGVVLSRRC